MSLTLAAGNTLSHSLVPSHSRLPAFDVKAYTFRKKPRHYVAVKHKNALRIEPIIYLKTSILDDNRQVVRDWDYLRFKVDRFRDNAQPKKKLSPEEMRGARVLDVDIVLVSPNNRDRIIEDSCPACVMRMDGERKIMQVLAKNFKQSPAGEPLIDIRKGHAIVCIKLNCYCDHHNEHEGFVVRMQTLPEVVRMGGSVKLRICCEARSKTGSGEQDAEEEEGLTDIDAPVSTGSRSPVIATNEQMLQSPSLSHASANSPLVRGHQRTPSTNSASMASPKSMDERVVHSLAVEGQENSTRFTNGYGQNAGNRIIAPPKFRQIYPLTPSEGTILGGTRVTIHGAHFDVLQNPVVYFGKVPAELVTVSHHDVMECTTPPAENLKPGIVSVQIASLAFPLSPQTEKVDFMYMAPPDYDFCNLAATSLSYGMANEYPQDNALAYLLNAHGNGAGIGLGLLDDPASFVGNDFDSESGHTLLHLAVQSGMSRLVKELVDMGIDHTAMDRNNKTALNFAHMLQNEEITQILTNAKVPPRPMVPRMSADDGRDDGRSRQDIVSSLIRRYEENLVKVVKQERNRKRHLLRKMKERTAHVMVMKDRAVHDFSSSNAARDINSAPESTSSVHSHHDHPRISAEDTEEDDIMEDDMSTPSSPENGKFGNDFDEEMSERDVFERERKRKADDDFEGLDDTAHKQSKPKTPTQAQLLHLYNGANSWEKHRGANLFGEAGGLSKDTPPTWACNRWSVSTLKASVETQETMPVNDAVHVLALTDTGLHYFTEEQASIGDASARSLEHWSLVEIENLNMTQNNRETSTVSMEMCGLVSRGGRDFFGERIDVELPNEDAQHFMNSLKQAHSTLMNRLNFHARFETPLIGSTSSQIVADKDEQWVDRTIRMWGKLFNVEDRIIESIDYSIRRGTFTLKPAENDRKAHPTLVIGAVMRTLREYDQCSKVRFEDVKVLEDGWRKPELIQELEKMSREMKHIDCWNFAGCRWTPETVKGFLSGLTGVDQQVRSSQGREPCRRISLARNDFARNNDVGHWLARCLEQWRQFRTLDLTDCNIGLGGIEALVKNLKNMFTIRLQGNQVDERWWQWTDSLLANNQSLQKFRLGAPIPPPTTDTSIVNLERLSKLQDITSLDLSTAPINHATITVLCTFVATHRELLTITLSRCQLEWIDLVPLFRTICSVNESTKFTLDVSQNMLFESEESVQAWTQSIAESGRRIDGTPFGIKIQGLVVRDAAMQCVLKALEGAICFNEFNVKGLLIKRESQVEELNGLPYEEVVLKIKPEDASKETCLGLGRVLTYNKTLVMLDISGMEIEQMVQDTASMSIDPVSGSSGHNKTNSGSLTRPESVIVKGRSTGGFGRRVSLAFPSLAENDTLRVLSMDYNRFGEDGMVALAEALKINTGLGVLSCDGNDAYTHKGLKAIEKILPPFHSKSTITPSRMASTMMETFQGTMEDAQAAGYNSTLSVWKLKSDEIMMHKDLISMEVERLMAHYHRIEKMHVRNREQEAKYGPMGGAGQIVSGDSLLKDAKERYEEATRDRAEYMDTYSRILDAIKENNRRTKEVYERKRMMEQVS
ncbi:hypothetical protein BCR41DRAFT_368070 [Lobosporangium transversale]|uniref:IPT/TIG domain-containing protein n=1 Tax=Lobosporangium transversale TaxID=64571 RepID=A0A1Y2GXT0_9FUNG|nr:hypothetical protein BCR41DRAFT_368070 [Lobosporangium transversale]ORZ27099.1 hypothetical protein BCR41DRAFT_368070 [Lobosporangium transversale]|eukprot:XP_021884846.1 hypothetical protein BCR41DRAFT_368070 [Lobosporangium transversale]